MSSWCTAWIRWMRYAAQIMANITGIVSILSNNLVANYTKLFLYWQCSGIAALPKVWLCLIITDPILPGYWLINPVTWSSSNLEKKILFHCFEISHVIAIGSESSLSVLNYCLAYMFLNSCCILLKSSCFSTGWLVHMYTQNLVV